MDFFTHLTGLNAEIARAESKLEDNHCNGAELSRERCCYEDETEWMMAMDALTAEQEWWTCELNALLAEKQRVVDYLNKR
jgi:hypothetical protein